MSDNEAAKGPQVPKATWTDRELLVYLWALVEQTGVKLDYANTPRPGGRSVIACKARVERLVKTLKDDLEALRSGQPIDGENTPKKTAGTPRKRKAKGEGDEGVNGTPTKRGRKKKVEVETEAEAEVDGGDDDLDEKFQVKTEPKDEEQEVDVEV